MRAALIGLAIAVSLVGGCRCSRPAPPVASDAATDAASDAAPPRVAETRVLLLLREEGFKAAAWTSAGAVVALSHRRFWWFRPEDGMARTTPIADAILINLVVAAKADVAAVSAGGRAQIFGPLGRELRSFAIGEGETAQALSEDGSLLRTENMRDWRYEIGHIYDVATGKHLVDVESVPAFSPGHADWLLAKDGVHDSRTGELVVAVKVRSWDGEVGWIDGRAVAWNDEGLAIADPKTKTATTIKAACKPGEINEYVELVDPIGKQALRYCGRHLLVARVTADGAAEVIDIPVPGSRLDGSHSFSFARDGDAIMVNWAGRNGTTVDRVDLPSHTLQHVTPPLPPSRMVPASAMFWQGGGAPSPDGRYTLIPDEAARDVESLVVLDADADANKREVARWGLPVTPQGDPIAAFLHEGGLEVATDVKGHRERLRIGPPATTPFDAMPLLTPTAPCGGADEFEHYERTLTGGASIFEYQTGNTCVCVTGGCADPKLPRGVSARLDDRLLVQPALEEEVTFLEKRERRGSMSAGRLWASAFLDKGEMAALVVGDHGSDDLELREVKLPSFASVRETTIKLPRVGGNFMAMGSEHSIVIATSYLSDLRAVVVPRAEADAGDEATQIDMWIGGAVVRFPDGKVELVGTNAEHALACIDDTTGIVTPYAACRDRFEVKNRFRIP